jgi:hypothetical protein
MSRTTTIDQAPKNEVNANSCCGGPAPNAANACCVRDAEAKTTGGRGCGCHSAPHATDSKAVCCA